MRVSNEVYFSRQRFSFFSFNSFFFLCAKNIVICRWGDEVERTSPFQIYYIHLRVGGRGEKTPSFDLFFRLRSRGAPTRRAPHLHSKFKRLRRRLLVNLRSRWSLTYMIHFIIAHFYRLIARVRIKCRMSYAHSVELKMFAR